jgi:hypothetical protein
VPEGGWEGVVTDCMGRMTTGVLPVLRRMGCEFDVPLTVEVAIGTRWSLSDVGRMS